MVSPLIASIHALLDEWRAQDSYYSNTGDGGSYLLSEFMDSRGVKQIDAHCFGGVLHL